MSYPIGVETKALDVIPPRDRSHLQIKKGLKQSKERKASYFIWTNGDCWQFYSLALPNAQIYQAKLNSVGSGEGQVESIANKLCIIEKERFDANPKIFDEDVCKSWKMAALPAAWDFLFEQHTNDLIQLVMKGLPQELDIKGDEILEFLKKLKTSDDVLETPIERNKRSIQKLKFPDEWEQLLKSYEPEYEKAREKFRTEYIRNLANWVISENYNPWSKSTTWRHAGLNDNPTEKKLSGSIVTFFKKWGFIKWEGNINKYLRVDEGVPYLKKLLD